MEEDKLFDPFVQLTPGSLWERTIAYESDGNLLENKTILEYTHHEFEDNIKQLHFKTMVDAAALDGGRDLGKIPTYARVAETDFPVTNIEMGDGESRASLIVYRSLPGKAEEEDCLFEDIPLEGLPGPLDEGVQGNGDPS